MTNKLQFPVNLTDSCIAAAQDGVTEQCADEGSLLGMVPSVYSSEHQNCIHFLVLNRLISASQVLPLHFTIIQSP